MRFNHWHELWMKKATKLCTVAHWWLLNTCRNFGWSVYDFSFRKWLCARLLCVTFDQPEFFRAGGRGPGPTSACVSDNFWHGLSRFIILTVQKLLMSCYWPHIGNGRCINQNFPFAFYLLKEPEKTHHWDSLRTELQAFEFCW